MPRSAAAKSRHVGARVAESSGVGGGRKFLQVLVPLRSRRGELRHGQRSAARTGVIVADCVEGLTPASDAAQEFQVTSLDQGDRIVNEAVRFAAGMRILPLDRTALSMVGGEHLRCHVARAAAKVLDVEGVKELDQAPFLKRRQPQSRRQKTDPLVPKTTNEV